MDRLASQQVAGRDRRQAILGYRKGAVGGVEPQARLSLRRVRAVTAEAAIGEDRPDVAIEIDRPRRRRIRDGTESEDQGGDVSEHERRLYRARGARHTGQIPQPDTQRQAQVWPVQPAPATSFQRARIA